MAATAAVAAALESRQPAQYPGAAAVVPTCGTLAVSSTMPELLASGRPFRPGQGHSGLRAPFGYARLVCSCSLVLNEVFMSRGWVLRLGRSAGYRV